MHIFDIFRRSIKKALNVETATRTPSEVIRQALASKGISATEAEVADVIARVSQRLTINRALPELLTLSESAELHFDGTDYIVDLSLFLADGSGCFPQPVLDTVCSIALYYATASELAGHKGRSEFALIEGQKIALCDVVGGSRGHPVYSLFPELLNKTVLTES